MLCSATYPLLGSLGLGGGLTGERPIPNGDFFRPGKDVNRPVAVERDTQRPEGPTLPGTVVVPGLLIIFFVITCFSLDHPGGVSSFGRW